METIHIQVKHYVNEAREQLLDLISSHNLILIEAPTGTGKTNFMTTLPGELIAPLKLIQDQMRAKVGLEQITTVRGTTNTEEQVYFSKFVSRTFASATERPSLNHEIVHIDEFHYTLDYALIDHDAYMAIEDKIYNSLTQGKTIILYSATPEIAMLLVELLGMPIELHIKLEATHNSCSPKSIEYWENKHPRGNSYSPNSHFISKVEEEIRQFVHKGKFVILCRTIKTAETLHSKLNKSFPNLNIDLYTSSHNNPKLTNSLINNELIPNSTNILITTTILSTGTNINNNDIYCAICEWPISTTIVQFSARFRSNNHHLIVYGSYSDIREGIQPYNFSQRLSTNFKNQIWLRYKMYSHHLADYYQMGEHQQIVELLSQKNSQYLSPFALIKTTKTPLTTIQPNIKLNSNWKQQLQLQIQTIEKFHKSTTKILVSIPKLINLQFRKQDEKWFEQEKNAINYILELFKLQSPNKIIVRTTMQKQQQFQIEQKKQLKFTIANKLSNYFEKKLEKEDKMEIINILKQFGINANQKTLKKEIENMFEVQSITINGRKGWKMKR